MTTVTEEPRRRVVKRPSALVAIAVSLLLLIGAALLSMFTGAVKLPPVDVTRELIGIGELAARDHAILWDIRLPRVAMGIIVGATLAIAASCVIALAPMTTPSAIAAPAAHGHSRIAAAAAPSNYVDIPAELLPPGYDPEATPPVDPVGAGIIIADYLGDAATRDKLITGLPEHRRAAMQTIIDAIHRPIGEPDYADATMHITVLGGGVGDDGTLPDVVLDRLETGLAEATANPGAPILVTSGSHLRRAVVDFTTAFGPGTAITGTPAPEPAGAPDADAQRRDTYCDALLWHLLPESVIVDGVPPIAGPGVSRFW